MARPRKTLLHSMKLLPALKEIPLGASSLVQRCVWAARAFMAPKKCAQIQMGNAVFDLERGVMIVPGDFTIHSTGNLKLKADQHDILLEHIETLKLVPAAG